MVEGRRGTWMATGEAPRSGSKSGMKAKSMVDVSLGDLSSRLVLKWRKAWPVMGAPTSGRFELSTAVLKVRAPFVSSWAERRDCSWRLC
jgi:hypothetical protein